MAHDGCRRRNEQPFPRYTETQRRHSGEPKTRSPIVKGNEVFKREYFGQVIVINTQKNVRTHHILRLLGYMSKDDKVKPMEHQLNRFIERYWKRIVKQILLANWRTRE